MQRIRTNKSLGIAVTEQGFLLAEISVSGDKRELVKTAEFPYPGGNIPADFNTLGRPLSAFLRQQGFSTRHAVIGLPARWVLVKPCEIPPADVTSAAKILRLQAESAFSSELKDLVFDFAGKPERAGPTTVLLMGTGKARLTQIEEMATQARLTVRAIVPSITALGSAMSAALGEERLILHIGARAVELAAYHGAEMERMRHVMTLPAEPRQHGQLPAELGPELRRTIASIPLNGTPASDRHVLLWDDQPDDEAARRGFTDRFGIALNAPALTSMGFASTTGKDEARFAAAAALARMGVESAPTPVNFAHSRMIPPKERTYGRKLAWAVAVVGTLLFALVMLVLDTHQRQADLARLKKSLADAKPAVDEATRTVDRVMFANNWIPHDVRYLECMHAVLTTLPPTDYASAYFTTFEAQSAFITADKKTPVAVLKGQLAGKASNQKTVNDIADVLRKNGALFSNVNVSDIRDAGANTRQVQFTITFTYIGKGKE